MNIDQFIRANDPTWRRLEDLTQRVRRRPQDLPRSSRDEFLNLYQLTSAHLSQLRSGSTDPQLDARLTRVLADASNALYGQQNASWKTALTFFNETFPAALWHLRRFIFVAAVLFFVPAILMGVWLGTSEAAQSAIPPEVAETYVNEDFESYYSSEAATEFATRVFVNNIWVSFLAFAVGILFCVGTAFVLIQNGIMLGQAAGALCRSWRVAEVLRPHPPARNAGTDRHHHRRRNRSRVGLDGHRSGRPNACGCTGRRRGAERSLSSWASFLFSWPPPSSKDS